MLTVEVRENTKTNFLKLWCETCARTLKLIDYGLEEVAPAMVTQLEDMAGRHERKNHKHKLYLYEGRRLPTLAEIRAAKRLG